MCPTLPRYPVYSYRRADGARDINAVGSGRPTNRPTKRLGSQRDDVAFESDFAPATTDVRSATRVARAGRERAPQRAGEPRGATVARVAKLRTRLARIGYVHRPLAGSARGRPFSTYFCRYLTGVGRRAVPASRRARGRGARPAPLETWAQTRNHLDFHKRETVVNR